MKFLVGLLGSIALGVLPGTSHTASVALVSRPC